MMSAGILVTFAGYVVGSYGYVLVKGWDITLRAWVSPFNPWTWTSGDPPLVPKGQIMPSGAAQSAIQSGQNPTVGQQIFNTVQGGAASLG